MKIKLAALAIAAAALVGCAAMESGNNEALMGAAGFQTRTPETPKQQQIYSGMPDYKIQRMNLNGKWLYLYKDPKQGVVYVGGDKEYQQFQQLAVQQSIASDQLNAAEINQQTAMDYSMWGPWGLWY